MNHSDAIDDYHASFHAYLIKAIFGVIGLIGYPVLLCVLYTDVQYSRHPSIRYHKAIAIVELLQSILNIALTIEKTQLMADSYTFCKYMYGIRLEGTLSGNFSFLCLTFGNCFHGP